MRALVAAVIWAACAAAACAAEAPAGTLLIGNKGEDTVSFVDLATGRELGRAATGDMPHEIAISPDGKRAAVVAYGGTTIDVFDVASRRKLQTLDLSPNRRPHGVVWLKDGNIVATAEGSQSVAVVAPDGAVRSIPTGAQGSHMLAVAQDGRTAYVANIGSGTVSVLDLAAGTKLRDIAVGGEPEGLALAKNGTELWVGDLSAPRVQVYATGTGEKLAEVAIDPVAIRVIASPDGKTIATSNVASGTVTLIDVDSREVTRTLSVSGEGEAGQVTLLFSDDGRRLYAAETGRDVVAEVDLGSGRVLRRLPAGKNGDGLAIAAAGAP